MRILVTGSRTWSNALDISQELRETLDRWFPTTFVVVHGDASGADTYAKRWAAANQRAFESTGVAHEPWPAGDDPLRRDREMVAAGADVCLAFIRDCPGDKPNCPPRRHGTHGATYTAKLAVDAGMEVHVYRERL